MKYTKAPVSEVIIGITFQNAAFSLDQIFKVQNELASSFPNTEIRPPLADESLVENRLSIELDPKNAGPFLLRMRTQDRKWLYQIQRNKIYVNWIRSDIEAVGNYVGFSRVFQKFQALCKAIGIDLKKLTANFAVKHFDVTYHDRIEWQNFAESISELSSIVHFGLPKINVPVGFNNVFSKYTYQLPNLGGYGLLTINTDTSQENTQLLKIKNITQGFLPDISFQEWAERANAIQVEYFEDLFTQETLSKWK